MAKKSKGGLGGIVSLIPYVAIAAVGFMLIRKAGAAVTSGGGAGGTKNWIPTMPGDGLGPTGTQVGIGPSTLPPLGWRAAFVADIPKGAYFTGDITKNEAPYAATDATPVKDASGKIIGYNHYWATIMLPGSGYSKVRVVPA